MTYELTINQKPTYLHAIVTGRNSSETVARYLEGILRECNDSEMESASQKPGGSRRLSRREITLSRQAAPS